MSYRWIWTSIAAAIALGTAAHGQGIAVQLPTYSFFFVDTTVSVPVGGSAYLGGVNRAASGANQFGTPLAPLGNRAAGSRRVASGVSVSATLHDFEAMDRFLLNQPTASYPKGLPAAASDRAETEPSLVISDEAAAERPVASVADLRARRLDEAKAGQHEASRFYDRGRAAESAGKANVARIYYQMAARRADGPLKAEILARLEFLGSNGPAARLAQNEP